MMTVSVYAIWGGPGVTMCWGSGFIAHGMQHWHYLQTKPVPRNVSTYFNIPTKLSRYTARMLFAISVLFYHMASKDYIQTFRKF